MYKKLTALLLAVFCLAPTLVLAGAFDYRPMEMIPGFEAETVGNFYTYIGAVYKFGLWTVGICAMFMIGIGGYMYIISAGNSSSMTKAKGVIIDAIAGLILALVSFLILYEINPNLVKLGGNDIGGNTALTEKIITSKTLTKGCENYANDFESASGGDKNLKCLLIGIANAESNCNPSAISKHNACGMMQILPATAGQSCEELLSNPSASIQKAASIIASSRNSIPSSSGFSLGTSYALAKTTVSYGDYTYDTGNDDLIAAYNAGSGKIAATPGKAGPFVVSTDCPSPTTPAWQCHINPGGFSETQKYVMRVQSFQAACLAK
ncbi:MAG: transglycosylase SLT domain-containing protein [Candidatus Moranbacteria bacterium]|nr:transglycosylase SLT domain-containing protein [Candidatus Moranbacteria bacterium]